MKQEDRVLIEKLDAGISVSNIVLSTDEVIIYTICERKRDEWSKKYPYRLIYQDNTHKWTRCSTVSPSLDVAYLVYLEHKYCGLNSQFSEFAIKMLGINLD